VRSQEIHTRERWEQGGGEGCEWWRRGGRVRGKRDIRGGRRGWERGGGKGREGGGRRGEGEGRGREGEGRVRGEGRKKRERKER